MPRNLPFYLTSPISPFLSLLYSCGYISHYTFSFEDPQAIWEALALGLISHTYLPYREFSRYIEETWRPRIRSIVEVDEAFVRGGNTKFDDPEYWMHLGQCCQELLFKKITPPLNDDIMKRRAIDFSERHLWISISEVLGICLCVYEMIGDFTIKTKLFNHDERDKPRFYVILATDCNSLYLLFHSDLDSTPIASFPFLTIGNKHQSGPPILTEVDPIDYSKYQQCRCCFGEWSLGDMLRHNCAVCLACSLKAWSEKQVCALCGNPFQERELKMMKKFYWDREQEFEGLILKPDK